MTERSIQVAEIIQFNLIKIKNTIGNIFQLIQYITTINTVTITNLQMHRRPLAGQ